MSNKTYSFQGFYGDRVRFPFDFPAGFFKHTRNHMVRAVTVGKGILLLPDTGNREVSEKEIKKALGFMDEKMEKEKVSVPKKELYVVSDTRYNEVQLVRMSPEQATAIDWFITHYGEDPEQSIMPVEETNIEEI